MSSKLRPYQITKIDELYDNLNRGETRIAFQAPTGAGKTIIATNVIQVANRTKRKALFTVPRLDLIDQTVEKIYNEGMYDVGVIQANHHLTNPNARIQVASVQTLQRRSLDKFPEVDVVIIDECHILFKRLYEEWMNDSRWINVPFIGLSATPWTKGLGKLFKKLIICTTTQELINEGYLSRFRVFAPDEDLDLSGVRTVAGDYHEGDLSVAMNKAKLIGNVVRQWKEKAGDRPTLCFGVDRAHAKNIENQFLNAGIPADYIDGNTPIERRKEIREAFHSGEIKVVCSIGCLTMGVDWDVRCIILARPTKSEMLFVQIIGRGLRTAGGKEDCIILDHSDTHKRLGFVTDIHHEYLDDGNAKPKKDEEKRLPHKCKNPQCGYMMPANVSKCPQCGHGPGPKVETIDGDLVELSPQPRKQIDPESFYRELKFIQEERGYKTGWVTASFKEKFGHWPPRGAEILESIEASYETRNWVRQRSREYAKAKEAEKLTIQDNMQ